MSTFKFHPSVLEYMGLAALLLCAFRQLRHRPRNLQLPVTNVVPAH